jgi:hypothetical protein
MTTATASPPVANATPALAGNPQESPTPKHEVTMKLVGSNPELYPKIPEMIVGDTFRFVSDQPGATILFAGASPFRADETTGTSIPEGVIVTLVSNSDDQPGRVFKGQCRMKGKNGKLATTYAAASLDGGDFPVRKPGL